MGNLLSFSGHAAYVWSAYAVTFVVLLGLIGLSVRQVQTARREELVLARVRRPRRTP